MRTVIILWSLYICLLSFRTVISVVWCSTFRTDAFALAGSIRNPVTTGSCGKACMRGSEGLGTMSELQFPATGIEPILCNPFEQCLWFGEMNFLQYQSMPAVVLVKAAGQGVADIPSGWQSDCFHPPEMITVHS